jgi:hypothetical protein
MEGRPMSDQRPVEQIAEGLQRLIAESEARGNAQAERAADRAADRAVARMEPKFEAIHESLRQLWKRLNGKGPLPIDVPEGER